LGRNRGGLGVLGESFEDLSLLLPLAASPLGREVWGTWGVPRVGGGGCLMFWGNLQGLGVGVLGGPRVSRVIGGSLGWALGMDVELVEPCGV